MSAPFVQAKSIVDPWCGHIERDAGGTRCQCLEVGTDLVGDVAIGSDAVGADDHRVDAAARQQQTGGVVGDQRVRHAVLT
jgi:hypothetical protein